MYFNYVHHSQAKIAIVNILKNYVADNGIHRAGVESIEAVADYLDNSELVTTWDMRTSDWPSSAGGEAFVAWVEDGYLYTWQWSYYY